MFSISGMLCQENFVLHIPAEFDILIRTGQMCINFLYSAHLLYSLTECLKVRGLSPNDSINCEEEAM